MKKKLFFAISLVFVVTVSASAQKEPPSRLYVSTPISYRVPFTSIVVNDGIDLVLIENSQDKIWFDGKQKNIDKLKWEIKNGTLHLASIQGSLKDKVRVHVYVNRVSNIQVNGDSWVKSSGYLASPNLKVVINGEALVDIANAGKISITNSRDFELGVMRKTSGVTVDKKAIK